jgi:hypothetical protein
MANCKNIALQAFGVLLLCALFAPAMASQPVGQVTLVIGNGSKTSLNGQTAALRKGDALKEGDRIETGQGGHVHIRFVDGAQVSVRPLSRLAVESYRQDDSPTGGMRLKLETGTVRSVTGKWGEENHDRFRLNTPIAAIGIRGTDFMVRSEAERVRVTVQSGAIVMAPLDGALCQQSGLGVCNTPSAKRLSAEMGDVMLELRHRQSAPELIPLRDLLPSERLQNDPAPKQSSVGTNKTKDNTSSNVLDSNPNVLNTEKTANNNVALVPVVTPVPEDKKEIPVLPQPAVTPPVVTPPPAVEIKRTLTWAHMYPAWIGDNLSKGYAEVQAGKQATVGTLSGQYILLRDGGSDVDMRPVFASTQGKIAFSLDAGSASLLRNGAAERASITNGKLSVDFTNRTFDTSLSVFHDATGLVNIQSEGDINRYTGIMIGRNNDVNGSGRVVGALSTDGKEAGLAFDRQVDQGLISGITLWSR